MLAGAAMISFAPVFVRLTSVPPTSSAFYRTLFGGVMLLAVLHYRGERLWSGAGAFLALFGAGLFFALDLWAWHRSIWFVGPGLATLLANFQVFCLALAVSPLGRIRLGGNDAVARYGYPGWLAMLFAAGVGIWLMFFGVLEPVTHSLNPPLGIDPADT